MKHALACLGAVGLLTGGLVVTSAEAAMAKSNVTLQAERPVLQAGSEVHLAGSAGDDAGVRKTLFCLQVRVAERRWTQVGRCVQPYRTDVWSAEFRLQSRPLTDGRFAFRAVGIDLHHRHRIYGPSPVVEVTVR
ncbi:MAG: hypothetical protein JWR24_2512 [Actinoallomurus sp.]|jgi:hypothetical protein|nr:hypothetical protein [Actinoallomurus sp.]